MTSYKIGQTVELVERFKNRYPNPRTAKIERIVIQEGVSLLQIEGLNRLRAFNEVKEL